MNWSLTLFLAAVVAGPALGVVTGLFKAMGIELPNP
jgi:hypothetical protein